MVWACENNGLIPYGQKGVDRGSMWMAGPRENEVGVDGWCEGGLGQQKNDGGGRASMRERSERVESPGTYITELVSRGHFCLALCFSARPPVLWWLSPGEGWDAVT